MIYDMNNILEGRNILVVDDEPDLREVLRDEFASYNCFVFEAENGEQAFNFVKQKKIDVIISDYRMPKSNGIELLEKIQNEITQKPLFFLLTGYTDFTNEDVYKKGAASILSKPCDLEKLIFITKQKLLLETKGNSHAKK